MSAHLVDHPPDHRDDPQRGMRRRLGRAKNTFDEGTPLAGRLPARSPLPTTPAIKIDGLLHRGPRVQPDGWQRCFIYAWSISIQP